jgi:hypothetical protein
MSAVNLAAVLQNLCEADPPEITGQAIEASECRADFEALIDIGALIPVGAADSILCFSCEEPHTISVEFDGNGSYRAYCVDAGYRDVQPALLRCFAVDIDWITASVASHLGLSVKETSPAARYPDIARVGRARFQQYVCEVFFARRLTERSSFGELSAQVRMRAANAPVVVLTTSPLDLLPGNLPPRCAAIPFAAVLEVRSKGGSFNDDPVFAVLRGRTESPAAQAIGFDFSTGFRSGRRGDQTYVFTDKQALVIETLYNHWTRRLPVHQTELQGAADTKQRVGQLFLGHPAYGTLIRPRGEGFYELDL